MSALALVAVLVAGDAADVEGAPVLLMSRDDAGESMVDWQKVGEDGTASFVVPTARLSRGCEFYTVYEGKETDSSWRLLPVQSDCLRMYDITQRQVTYEAGNGTNTAYNPAMLTSLSDVAQLRPSLRRGYTFDGWLDEGSVEIALLGAEQAAPSDALALKATYTANSYPISYELDGGTNSAQNPSSYTVDDAVRLQPASKAGYVFGGWYLDSAHTQPTNTVPLNSIAPVTFYAAWDAAKPSGGIPSGDEGLVSPSESTGDPSDASGNTSSKSSNSNSNAAQTQQTNAAPSKSSESGTSATANDAAQPNRTGATTNGGATGSSNSAGNTSNAAHTPLANTGEGPWLKVCVVLAVCGTVLILVAHRRLLSQ